MLFAVTCIDKTGHAAVRTDNRSSHLEFLKANADAVKIAGPMLTDDGAGMVGSLLVIEAADRSALDALLAEDPYAKAGLFERIEIRPWRWVIGNPG
ncbi:YciI family protein [Chthonobacter albigriseus]|uniref:YciI family protein n=1 Tax=Chthonobacter albigriseus TaxID=1683161 RepID=UPI0015EF633D|nr:YciI family protein [Chthonobacter albigriseus]